MKKVAKKVKKIGFSNIVLFYMIPRFLNNALGDIKAVNGFKPLVEIIYIKGVIGQRNYLYLMSYMMLN